MGFRNGLFSTGCYVGSFLARMDLFRVPFVIRRAMFRGLFATNGSFADVTRSPFPRGPIDYVGIDFDPPDRSLL